MTKLALLAALALGLAATSAKADDPLKGYTYAQKTVLNVTVMATYMTHVCVGYEKNSETIDASLALVDIRGGEKFETAVRYLLEKLATINDHDSELCDKLAASAARYQPKNPKWWLVHRK